MGATSLEDARHRDRGGVEEMEGDGVERPHLWGDRSLP